MCYDNTLQHKGLNFFISDCFGVGFDWKDETFKEAVNNKDERVFEILNWAANGGADKYNEAAQFHYDVVDHYDLPSIYRHLKHYSEEELRKYQDNPYLSGKDFDIIVSYLDGSLGIRVRQIEEREKPTRKSKNTAGYVYLIKAENGLYKIGKAKNVTTRLQPFSVHFPMKWELVHSFKADDYSDAEATLHIAYANKRDVGEWFRLDPEDVEYIASLQDGQL